MYSRINADRYLRGRSFCRRARAGRRRWAKSGNRSRSLWRKVIQNRLDKVVVVARVTSIRNILSIGPSSIPEHDTSKSGILDVGINKIGSLFWPKEISWSRRASSWGAQKTNIDLGVLARTETGSVHPAVVCEAGSRVLTGRVKSRVATNPSTSAACFGVVELDPEGIELDRLDHVVHDCIRYRTLRSTCDHVLLARVCEEECTELRNHGNIPSGVVYFGQSEFDH